MGQHFAFSVLKSTPLEKQVQAVAVVTKIGCEIELKMLHFRIPKDQLIPISLIFFPFKKTSKNETSHCVAHIQENQIISFWT